MEYDETKPDATRQSHGEKTYVCPWWLMNLFGFADSLRRWLQPTNRILQPLVVPGDTCLDVGCGTGFFTIPLAELVGPTGRVIGVDLQPRMLAGAARRAQRHGMEKRISLYRPDDREWMTPQTYDFILIFWMLHEVRDRRALLETLGITLKPNGRMLLVEPRLHVRKRQWESTLALAKAADLETRTGPAVALSRSAVLQQRDRRPPDRP